MVRNSILVDMIRPLWRIECRNLNRKTIRRYLNTAHIQYLLQCALNYKQARQYVPSSVSAEGLTPANCLCITLVIYHADRLTVSTPDDCYTQHPCERNLYPYGRDLTHRAPITVPCQFNLNGWFQNAALISPSSMKVCYQIADWFGSAIGSADSALIRLIPWCRPAVSMGYVLAEDTFAQVKHPYKCFCCVQWRVKPRSIEHSTGSLDLFFLCHHHIWGE